MKGVWLTQHECQNAMNVSQYQFEKDWKQKLEAKQVKRRTKFFLPESKMTEKAKKQYKEHLIAYDEDAMNVESILGDISEDGLSDDWKTARLENIRARTKLIEEKLENRKKELWQEWNEAFFETFAEAFAKYKNDLISLHLSEEQLKTLAEKLENALALMHDKLEAMWNKFSNEDMEQEEK